MRKIKAFVLSGIFILFAAVMLDTASVSAASVEASIGNANYDTLEDAISAVKSGETIKLNKNVKRDKKLTINRSGIKFTLNLNKKTLSFNDNGYLNLKKGNLTIKNGTVQGPFYEQRIRVASGQTLKITSGTYKTEIYNKGTLKLTGGTFKNDISNKGTAKISGKVKCSNWMYIWNSGTMKISKGTFSNMSIRNCPKSKLIITGGTYKGDTRLENENATVTIKGGTFKSTKKLKDPDSCMIRSDGKKAKMTVSGGTFKATNGRSVFYNFEGKLTIKKGKITYKSTKKRRQAAIMNAGGTLKISGGTVTSNQYGIACMGYYKKGTVKISKGTFKTTGGTRYSLLVAGDDGKITVTGGTFKAPKTYLYSRKTDYNGDGTVVLKGGKFSGVKYKKRAGKTVKDNMWVEG